MIQEHIINSYESQFRAKACRDQVELLEGIVEWKKMQKWLKVLKRLMLKEMAL